METSSNKMRLIITNEGEQVRQAFLKEKIANNAKNFANESVNFLDESIHSLHEFNGGNTNRRTSG